MIHQPESARPDKTITNFSIGDYDFKIPELTQMTQEDLVLALRRLGRKQASENNANGGSKRGSAMLHPLHDNAEEARIREDLGLGNKDPTCKQMYAPAPPTHTLSLSHLLSLSLFLERVFPNISETKGRRDWKYQKYRKTPTDTDLNL